jgi:hypothetical protein
MIAIMLAPLKLSKEILYLSGNNLCKAIDGMALHKSDINDNNRGDDGSGHNGSNNSCLKL